MVRPTVLGVALAATLVSPAATAQALPTVRLSYALAPGAANSCPSEASFRNAVIARLGYDPFRDDAATVITTAIRETTAALTGRIDVRDAAGRATGSRVMRSPRAECGELVASMAVAVSIAIDPLSVTRTASAPAPAIAREPEPAGVATHPAEPAPVAVTPVAPAAQTTTPTPIPTARVAALPLPRLAWRAGAGIAVSYGAQPDAALGPVVALGLQHSAFSLDLEGRAEWLLATATVDRARVDTVIAAATVVPCGHYRVLMACATVGLGAFRATAPAAQPARWSEAAWATVGVRVGLEIPVAPSWFVRLHADVAGALTRTSLVLDGRVVWEAPVVMASGGAAVFVRIP